MSKILAVDLDGTLFDDNKNITKDNLEALVDFLDRGNVLCVDTGRPIHVLRNILKDIPLFFRDNVYLLGYQGTIGVRSINNEMLFGQYLDNEPAIKLLKYSKDAGYSTLAFEYGKIYSFRQDECIDRYSAVSKEPITIIDEPEYLMGHDLTKIIVMDYVHPDSLFDFQAKHEEEMSSHFASMFSNVAFLEYINKESSKGAGLKMLAELLGVSMADTIACGDERNDISMVEAAGIGVAVANARPELKEVADYITSADNNHDAVAEVIREFVAN